MKNLKDYLNEGLLSRKISTKTPIRYTPTSRYELKNTIEDLLSKGQTNLNCIDVFKIKDMSWLFSDISMRLNIEDIDISEWNVSNVKDMNHMFAGCNEFNSDLSKWDVSNVKWLISMFENCSKFNSNLTNWNIQSSTKFTDMFLNCDTLKKNNKIPDWYTGKL